MNKERSLAPIDLFAPSVALTFKGERNFKTNFGGSASLCVYIIVIFMVVLKTKELLLGHSDAAHYMTETILEDDVKINLRELEHSFAVNTIDPRIGRIEVNQVTRIKKPKERIRTPIDMVECTFSQIQQLVGI